MTGLMETLTALLPDLEDATAEPHTAEAAEAVLDATVVLLNLLAGDGA